jgi:hypothetical protein
MSSMSPRKAGRPSKGDRLIVSARVPVELKHAAVETAKKFGLSENDYILSLVAAHTGLTHLAPNLAQEVLPLRQSA